MKKFVLISLLFYNAVIWTDAYAAEKDYLGIPVDNHILWGVASAGIIADWGTTLDIERNYQNGYFESNRMMGKYPSRGKINRYFITKLAAYAFVNMFKPMRKLKNIFNIHQSYISWSAVNHNIKAGLTINF